MQTSQRNSGAVATSARRTLNGKLDVIVRSKRLRLALLGSVFAALMMPATSLAGNWEWWGYRTNSSQTWALASQTPARYNSYIPGFGWAVYTMGWSWHWNAQSARQIGKCTGLTWSASPIFVGCSNR